MAARGWNLSCCLEVLPRGKTNKTKTRAKKNEHKKKQTRRNRKMHTTHVHYIFTVLYEYVRVPWCATVAPRRRSYVASNRQTSVAGTDRAKRFCMSRRNVLGRYYTTVMLITGKHWHAMQMTAAPRVRQFHGTLDIWLAGTIV